MYLIKLICIWFSVSLFVFEWKIDKSFVLVFDKLKVFYLFLNSYLIWCIWHQPWLLLCVITFGNECITYTLPVNNHFIFTLGASKITCSVLIPLLSSELLKTDSCFVLLALRSIWPLESCCPTLDWRYHSHTWRQISRGIMKFNNFEIALPRKLCCFSAVQCSPGAPFTNMD